MWITDGRIGGSLYKSNFVENNPFYALILPLKGSEFANLIRLGESQLHNEINLRRISDKSKREKLTKYLDNIKKFLQENIEKNTSDSLKISVPEIEIQMVGETKSKNSGVVIPKIPKTTTIERGSVIVEDPDTEHKIQGKITKTKNNNKRVTKPIIMQGFSSSHKSNLKSSLVKFRADKDYANLILKMRVDNGTDESCDSITANGYMNLNKAENVNTQNEYKILKDKNNYKNTIFIGNLTADESVEIVIEFENELGGNFVINYDFMELKESNDE